MLPKLTKSSLHLNWVPKLCVTSVIALTMASCSTIGINTNTPKATNISTNGEKIVINSQGIPNYYLVKEGDTVSKIARRYSLNFRSIGQLNGLDSRYTIYKGQWLKLWDTNVFGVQSTITQHHKSNTVLSGVYQYPTGNSIISYFNSNNGIVGMWFTGAQGDPVVASQGGTVVYSGDGLPEYGKLILIQHRDGLVTAYAHNSMLYVKEGDRVNQGQQIAAMGKTGQTNQVGLEFQVRKNGVPIDPMTVISKSY